MKKFNFYRLAQLSQTLFDIEQHRFSVEEPTAQAPCRIVNLPFFRRCVELLLILPFPFPFPF